MNILYVYDGHWPHNATRVAKQTDSLVSAGHHVTILSRGAAGRPRFERNDGVTAVRLPYLRWKTANRVVSFPIFLNPVWIRAIAAHVRASPADCIIVRDLPLAPAAVWVARSRGIPVHYDMAEVYPAALHSMLPHESALFLRAVRSTRTADAIERWVVRRVDTTFVVSEESRARCVRLGVPPEQVVLVGNTPANPDELKREWPCPEDIRDLQNRPTALFVGNLFADRGLNYAILAMAEIVPQLPTAALVIIGDGRERDRLDKQIAILRLQDHVRLLGWKHHREHAAYLRHVDVGILPFLATEHIRITLANKLFDYMGAGLPVVASDVPPMRRIVEETESGLLVSPENSQALADALLRLFRDIGLCRRLGENGRAAIAGKYAWSNDAARLVAAIERAQSRT